ncbi:alpha/beta fold hydrolase [Streptomyces pathocidini]|uniref:Alpha/beta fold hydrolase n=1 Tax=Streptomyces pathocidini TaxID=1650571 RepID=A0ABW7UVM8_9ACTN|nr:alpha/beta hydrolase [Streptomyces pathocidini]
MLRVGGLPTHVLREGAGPVCVLSGGLGSCWFDWDAVVPLLAPHRTVVRFDRPGLGLSAPAPPDRPPTAGGEAERILGVLDALGLPGPATVVGHSLAGFHAEAFARLYPRRTAGLVLVDASVEEEAREPGLPVWARVASAHALAGALGAAGLPYALGRAARRAAVRVATVRHREPGSDAAVRRCYRTTRVLRASLVENATYADVAAEVAGLRERRPLPDVPVTVLAAYTAGESPRELRWLDRQRGLAAELGGAEFRISAPAGHLLMMDDPAAIARAVLG